MQHPPLVKCPTQGLWFVFFFKNCFFILYWGRATLMTHRQRTHLPMHKTQETGVYPCVGRSPGEGKGHPLQYSCLGNLINRGATAHGVTKSRTQTEQLTFSFHMVSRSIWDWSDFSDYLIHVTYFLLAHLAVLFCFLIFIDLFGCVGF